MKYINDCPVIDLNAEKDLLQASAADINTLLSSDNGIQTVVTLTHDDYAIFTHYLKIAIDYDRSERLGDMIKTTGYQLYSTFIGRLIGVDASTIECNGDDMDDHRK